MAHHIRYIRPRSNGVYYYERRVPQAVIDRPADWERYFKKQRLFRRSLQTKRQIDALPMAEQAHREFDELVAKALGRSLPRDGLPGDRNTRPLTPSIVARATGNAGALAGGKFPVVIAFLTLYCFLSALWAAPSYATVAQLVPEREKAQAVAALLVGVNLIGSVVGPPLAGWLSDMMTPVFGTEALRYSLIGLAIMAPFGSVWQWRASSGLRELRSRDKPALPSD